MDQTEAPIWVGVPQSAEHFHSLGRGKRILFHRLRRSESRKLFSARAILYKNGRYFIPPYAAKQEFLCRISTSLKPDFFSRSSW